MKKIKNWTVFVVAFVGLASCGVPVRKLGKANLHICKCQDFITFPMPKYDDRFRVDSTKYFNLLGTMIIDTMAHGMDSVIWKVKG